MEHRSPSICAAVVAAVAFAISPASGLAQQTDSTSPPPFVAVGSRVRVSSSAVGGQLRGIVAAVDEKSLTLSREEGPPLVIPVTTITAIDISNGRKGHALRGFLIAAPLYALIGLALPVDPNNCGPSSNNLCSRGGAVALSAAAGGGAGALIGTFIKSDRWAPVILGASRSSAGPQRQPGLRVAIAFRF